ncbi:hypothetical protein BBP40_010382 [Aspergillus hancockii]|nr:hypothetical protein BBP40_010382 [Aspergillus hancockii]
MAPIPGVRTVNSAATLANGGSRPHSTTRAILVYHVRKRLFWGQSKGGGVIVLNVLGELSRSESAELADESQEKNDNPILSKAPRVCKPRVNWHESGHQPYGDHVRLAGGVLSVEDLLSHRQEPAGSLNPTLDDSALSTLLAVSRRQSLTESTTQYTLPFSLGQAISSNPSLLPEPSLPVTDAEKAWLISSYLRETGNWCETTDSQMQFTVQSVHSMMASATFAAAAMSLASRQLDHIEQRQHSVTLELYQYTIRLLIGQGPGEADASVLATCILLCVYEMMASNVSEWRRQLKSCAGLLQAKGWNGSSKGIVESCSWAFARIGELLPTARTTLFCTI